VASPTGIIPESLFDPSKKRQVLDWLIAQPLPADTKRTLLLGWAMWVGVKVRGADYIAVEESGIDTAPPSQGG
jgi:hypothetical protein